MQTLENPSLFLKRPGLYAHSSCSRGWAEKEEEAEGGIAAARLPEALKLLICIRLRRYMSRHISMPLCKEAVCAPVTVPTSRSVSPHTLDNTYTRDAGPRVDKTPSPRKREKSDEYWFVILGRRGNLRCAPHASVSDLSQWDLSICR